MVPAVTKETPLPSRYGENRLGAGTFEKSARSYSNMLPVVAIDDRPIVVPLPITSSSMFAAH
jgi:hypothetical protein